MNRNPWENIKIPKEGFAARLANPSHPMEFYWAKDIRGHSLFLLHSKKDLIALGEIPKLNGIEIYLGRLVDEHKDQLVLKLTEEENRDIFFSLCRDLLEATVNTTDEQNAVQIILMRLGRWQQFLKKGGRKIDERVLRGLFGELWFLEKRLMILYDSCNAINFWSGAEGDRHDFGVGLIHIEVKTRTSTTHNRIAISSPEQLECENGKLYLYVLILAKSSADEPNALSVPDLVQKIRKHLDVCPDTLEKFESLLLEYGYFDLDEYLKFRYIVASEQVYLVSKSFPRLPSPCMREELTNIRFDLELSKCRKWLVSVDNFLDNLKGGRDGDY